MISRILADRSDLGAAIAAVAFIAFVIPVAALGQPDSPISAFYDPSIVSAGMGGAGVAVFWNDTNDWANPSLLGYQKGIRYSYGRTQLAPELSDHVFFTSHRFAIGTHGVGISIAGRPIGGLGGNRLDYGESEATDVEGNVVGIISSREDVRSFGVAVNVIEALESLFAAMGSEVTGLNNWVDFSIGHSWKEITQEMSSESLSLDERGEATETDIGGLARLTPIGAAPSSPVSLDFSVAFSRRNYDDSQITFFGGSDPILEERVVGGASRMVFHLPARAGGLWNFLSPEIGLGGTIEKAHYHEGGDELPGTIERTGQELSLLGILSLRHGFVDYEGGFVHGETWGVSAGLQYRGIVGARYEWARVPQYDFMDDIDRHGVTVFFDPFRLWRLKQGEDAMASR